MRVSSGQASRSLAIAELGRSGICFRSHPQWSKSVQERSGHRWGEQAVAPLLANGLGPYGEGQSIGEVTGDANRIELP